MSPAGIRPSMRMSIQGWKVTEHLHGVRGGEEALDGGEAIGDVGAGVLGAGHSSTGP